MAIWSRDEGARADWPTAVDDILGGKRYRHRTPVVDESGRRVFVSSAIVGVATTVALLDACRQTQPDPRPSGELRFYQHVLAGVRQFVDAGAVAPTVATVGGEHLLRWQIVPVAVWRGWFAALRHNAPPILDANGGPEAIADLIAEFTDFECRRRLAGVRSGDITTPAVHALLPDSDAPPPRIARAAPAWAQWTESAAAAESVLVLRLHEPDDDTGGLWRLQVCRRLLDGSIEPVVPHRLDAGDLDTVTTDLARVVDACAALARAEHDPHSLDFLLPTETTEEFLNAGANTLAQTGFHVLLPRTIATVTPTLSVRALPVPGSGTTTSVLGTDDLRDFEWRLALGDSPGAPTLSQADLDELAHQQGNLVRLRGRWVRAEGDSLTRAARYIAAARRRPDEQTPADLAELFAVLTADELPVPVSSVQGLSWLDDAITGALRPTSLPPPATLSATLRPYQQRGFEWLAYLSAHRIGGVLADDMGLGKTIQVIALTCYELEGRRTNAASPSGPVTLVVCPMSLVGNWAREFARFAPDVRVLIHHGSARHSGTRFATAVGRVDVVITTYALATRDTKLLTAHRWRRVVVDEAQHVKNVATRAAKALRSIPAEHRVALTGTPVENRLEDLRALIDLVNPGLLGSASMFRARFADPIERERDPHALRRLTSITAPFILRREKTDPKVAGDLPAKDEVTVRANLTVEQAALYRAIVDELMTSLRDAQQRALRRRTVLAALTRLKQVCNHPAHYLADGSAILRRNAHRSGKVELLTDIATTVTAEGDRTLVFTQFTAFAQLLAPWLTEQLGHPVPILHGGLARTARDDLVAQFQSADGPPVLLATLKAGGTGLNLTAANQVVHADRWWNPAVEEQATDRAYRLGQTRNVAVRKFVCVGTLEERIDEMIAAKRELSALTVNAGEHWLGDIGDEQLYDLFALRDEAVSE